MSMKRIINKIPMVCVLILCSLLVVLGVLFIFFLEGPFIGRLILGLYFIVSGGAFGAMALSEMRKDN